MKKIQCLNPIAACGTELFPADYTFTDQMAEADAVLVRSASMHELELPEGLLAVGRAGAGVNNIPLDECAKKGIVVFNTPGANANGVKELVLAGLFLASRDIAGGLAWCKENAADPQIAKTTEKSKKAFAGCEIKGKKLGVIGLGAIGAEVDRVILTPHLGASTKESEDNCAVMAVKELTDYLENGNIRNSVNFPGCDMGVCQAESRIAVLHMNIPNMIGQITGILAAQGVNITDMTNKSRDKYAYTLLDLEHKPEAATIEKLKAIEGVLRVRKVK